MAEDERVELLLQQADRALEALLPSKHIAKDVDTSSEVDTVEHLKKVIENLEQKLKAKDALCRKLEATVNKLLLTMDGDKARVGGSKNDLSEEYFLEVLQVYKAQLWFRRQLPPIVEGIYERLKARVEHEYEIDKRRTAFTMMECQNAVNQIRLEWEEELPIAVSRSLTSENRVFACAADRSTKAGDACEAVHYLVYLVYKMYNRAAHVLHSLKQKESISKANDESQLIAKMMAIKATGTSNASDDFSTQVKWNNNPHALLNKFLVTARKSVYYTRSLHDEVSCRNAITISVGKLMTKPTLSESLDLLASIIALKEYAQVKKWNVDSSVLLHRDVFQYKMLEVWNFIEYNEDWTKFRTSFFKAINSMLAFVLIIRPDVADPVLKYLSSVVKPGHRKDFDSGSLALYSERSIEPLFLFMQRELAMALTPEYMSAYSWLFVFLLQALALKFDSETNHETILLNIAEDLRIHVKQTSVLEKRDYVRAISITCSVILGATYNDVDDEENLRAKYAASACFLSSRIGYLLCKRTDTDGGQFWQESPVPGYKLIDYCDETMVDRVKKHTRLLNLPLLNHEVSDEDDFELLGDSDGVPASPKVGVTAKDGKTVAESVNPISIRGLKVAELQQLLAERQLSIIGKKKELQERLLDTGMYAMEAPPKKQKTNAKGSTGFEASDADSSD